MIQRALAQRLASSKKSLLLLGPRQTGKSTLMRSLGPDLEIDLAHESTFLEFARNPRELEEPVAPIANRDRPVTILLIGAYLGSRSPRRK